MVSWPAGVSSGLVLISSSLLLQLIHSLSVTAVACFKRLCRGSHLNNMCMLFQAMWKKSKIKIKYEAQVSFSNSATWLIQNKSSFLPLLFPSALGLRNPLAVQGAYPPGAFGLPPPGVNGDLPGAAGYGAGLHLVSPQMNGAAAAAAAAAAGYGRSPVVSSTLCT